MGLMGVCDVITHCIDLRFVAFCQPEDSLVHTKIPFQQIGGIHRAYKPQFQLHYVCKYLEKPYAMHQKILSHILDSSFPLYPY